MPGLERLHVPDDLVATVAEANPVQIVALLLSAPVESNHGQAADAPPGPVVFLLAATGHVWDAQGRARLDHLFAADADTPPVMVEAEAVTHSMAILDHLEIAALLTGQILQVDRLQPRRVRCKPPPFASATATRRSFVAWLVDDHQRTARADSEPRRTTLTLLTDCVHPDWPHVRQLADSIAGQVFMPICHTFSMGYSCP